MQGSRRVTCTNHVHRGGSTDQCRPQEKICVASERKMSQKDPQQVHIGVIMSVNGNNGPRKLDNVHRVLNAWRMTSLDQANQGLLSTEETIH
jgi:hypothetical protein